MAIKKTQREIASDSDSQGALHIEYSASDAGEESVAINWAGEQDLPINGWQIRDDEARHSYTFGDVILTPGATVRLHAGGDSAEDSASDVYWAGDEDRWHDGDVLHLLNPRGLVRAQCACNTAITGGATAVTRKRTVARKASTRAKSTQHKSQAIRDYFAAHPEATADEVVERLGRKGITTNRRYVTRVMSASRADSATNATGKQRVRATNAMEKSKQPDAQGSIDGASPVSSHSNTTIVVGDKSDRLPLSEANENAMRVIWTYVAMGSGIGLVPLPLFDIAALTSLQLFMIKALGEFYGVKFTEGIGRKAIFSLIGGSLPVWSLRIGAYSLLRIVPFVGPTISALTVPILAGATTYAVGRVFNLHFATGGTFLSFDPERYRRQFQREFAEGIKLVRRQKQQLSHG